MIICETHNLTNPGGASIIHLLYNTEYFYIHVVDEHKIKNP